MFLNYKYEDIINFTEDILIHQVNTRGVMGCGVAEDIRRKWFEVYQQYKSYCSSHSGKDLLGTVLWTSINNGEQAIANAFGQEEYSRKYRATNYNALVTALVEIFKYAGDNSFSVAIPFKMSCNNAGGNWNYVLNLIKMLSEQNNVKVTIYKKNKCSR